MIFPFPRLLHPSTPAGVTGEARLLAEMGSRGEDVKYMLAVLRQGQIMYYKSPVRPSFPGTQGKSGPTPAPELHRGWKPGRGRKSGRWKRQPEQVPEALSPTWDQE